MSTFQARLSNRLNARLKGAIARAVVVTVCVLGTAGLAMLAGAPAHAAEPAAEGHATANGRGTDAPAAADHGDGHGEGHGGGHAHEAHIANVWGFGEQYKDTPALGWLSITFLTFVAILVVIWKKMGAPYLATRADTVQQAIDEATRAKEDALKRAREAEQKLASLDGEMKAMRADFEAQGRAEAERLEGLAKDTAKRIQKDAEDTIAAEVARAQQTLRAEAAKIALELATERIKQAIKPEDEQRLTKALLAGLSDGAPQTRGEA